MTSYKTIARQSEDEFTERRSRFIGYAKPVQTEEDAISFINEIRSMHWDASHNVYAYSLREGGLRRYSDDGEPQGTAGIPTLDVLQKSGVTDAVVVVTRYFGGILLGGGGLVRAYSHGAKLALEAAGILTMTLCKTCTLTCDYNQYGRVASLVPDCGGVIDDTRYTDLVALDFHIMGDQIAALDRKLADATCGKVAAEITGEMFIPD